jgi:hypothetical protein
MLREFAKTISPRSVIPEIPNPFVFTLLPEIAPLTLLLSDSLPWHIFAVLCFQSLPDSRAGEGPAVGLSPVDAIPCVRNN